MCTQFLKRVLSYVYLTLILLYPHICSAQDVSSHRRASFSLSCVDCHREALSNEKLPFVQKAQCTPCHQKSFQHTTQLTDQAVFNRQGSSPSSSPLISANKKQKQKSPKKSHSDKIEFVPLHASHMYKDSSLMQGRVIFNHKAHLMYAMSCERCHTKSQNFKPEVTSYLIPIKAEDCVQCHQSKKISIQCHTCHESTALGKLRIRWYNGTQADLIPRTSHSKMIHHPNYSRDHKVDALAYAQECLQCHQQSSCDQCHSTGRNRLQVHSPFYIKLHGSELQGQKSTRDCQSCHEPTRFCAPCHQRSGLHTRASALSFAQLGTQKVSFHRPGFAQAQHGIEASRDLGQCISCHSERDCMACHSSDSSLTKRQTRGRVVNPHRKNPCLIPKRASDLSCRACHMNRSRLQLCR